MGCYCGHHPLFTDPIMEFGLSALEFYFFTYISTLHRFLISHVIENVSLLWQTKTKRDIFTSPGCRMYYEKSIFMSAWWQARVKRVTTHLEGDESLEQIIAEVQVMDDTAYQIGSYLFYCCPHQYWWYSFPLTPTKYLELLTEGIHLQKRISSRSR